MDLTFGLGVSTMFLLGAGLLLVGYFGKESIGQKGARWLMIFGVIAVLLAGAVYVGVDVLIEPPAQMVPGATYDVTCTESEAELSVDSTAHTMTWAMDYNKTSNAFENSTGVATFNFTMARGDTLLTNSIANVAIGAVPSVDIAGAADEYLIDQNADDSFNALMTKVVDGSSITAYENINVLIEAGSSESVRVQITLNGDAAHGMTANDIYSFNIVAGGEVWRCTVIADDIHA